MQKVSAHVSYKESIKSNTAARLGIENEPNSVHWENMKAVSEACFEPIRKAHGHPIGITSFYRSEELCEAIGSSKKSQHAKGEAMDIDADLFHNGISNYDIGIAIRENTDFDQLIFEYWNDETSDFSWIHVSHKRNGNNRGQVLEAYRDSNNRTKYRLYHG